MLDRRTLLLGAGGGIVAKMLPTPAQADPAMDGRIIHLQSDIDWASWKPIVEENYRTCWLQEIEMSLADPDHPNLSRLIYKINEKLIRGYPDLFDPIGYLPMHEGLEAVRARYRERETYTYFGHRLPNMATITEQALDSVQTEATRDLLAETTADSFVPWLRTLKGYCEKPNRRIRWMIPALPFEIDAKEGVINGCLEGWIAWDDIDPATA